MISFVNIFNAARRDALMLWHGAPACKPDRAMQEIEALNPVLPREAA